MVEENRIFVGGLPQTTDNARLLEYFAPYGAVDCEIKWDTATGRSKGFGFVTFQDNSQVQDALAVVHEVDGKTVECKESVVKGLAPPPTGFQQKGKPKGGGKGTKAAPFSQPLLLRQPPAIQRQAPVVHRPMPGSRPLVSGAAPAGVPASGAAPNEHKIFVGGLSQHTTKESLEGAFNQFGDCEGVVMMDKVTGRSRGFGFVTFMHQDAVYNVLASGVMQVDGKDVECKSCEEAGTTPQTPIGRSIHAPVQQLPVQAQGSFEATRIFVGGLPQTCDDNRLAELFSMFGNLTEAKVHMDPTTNRSKGFGYVSFDNPQSVELVLANGGSVVIDDKVVEVKRCESKQKTKVAALGFQAPMHMPDVGVPVAPGSPAAAAVKLLNNQQALQIRGMVHLLYDPTAAAAINALIAQIQHGGGAVGLPRGGVRYSPY